MCVTDRHDMTLAVKTPYIQPTTLSKWAISRIPVRDWLNLNSNDLMFKVPFLFFPSSYTPLPRSFVNSTLELLLWLLKLNKPSSAILNTSKRQLTLCQTSRVFCVSAVQVFWKHRGEKEKLLVTSNFSFSHSVFYPSCELSSIFIQSKIVVDANSSSWKSVKFVVLKSVKLFACRARFILRK